MGYYKFNPRNHICSLAWTALLLASQLDSDSTMSDKILAPVILGLPTVFLGMNLREKAERNKRKRVVEHIHINGETTVGQIANLLDTTGHDARNILDSLVREERVHITNRSSDMAVVYVPAV